MASLETTNDYFLGETGAQSENIILVSHRQRRLSPRHHQQGLAPACSSGPCHWVVGETETNPLATDQAAVFYDDCLIVREGDHRRDPSVLAPTAHYRQGKMATATSPAETSPLLARAHSTAGQATSVKRQQRRRTRSRMMARAPSSTLKEDWLSR